jgi:hypothetical protein
MLTIGGGNWIKIVFYIAVLLFTTSCAFILTKIKSFIKSKNKTVSWGRGWGWRMVMDSLK